MDTARRASLDSISAPHRSRRDTFDCARPLYKGFSRCVPQASPSSVSDPHANRAREPSVVKLTKDSDEGGAVNDGTQDAHWRVVTNDLFYLQIAGRTKAAVNLAANVAFLDLPDGRAVLPVPHSEPIFDLVEQRLGTEKVTEFRTAAGVSDTDWRGIATKIAESFRRNCPPQLEPEHYTRAAWTVLYEKARQSGPDTLSPAADKALGHLTNVVTGLNAQNGEWTERTITHLGHAQMALREGMLRNSESADNATTHELGAHLLCEMATAVLWREGIMELHDCANAPAPHGPSSPPDAPDACWMELGPGRYGLLVDGQKRAVAHLGLKTGAIFDPDTLRLETISALDSETIFDALEERVGLSRVTTFTSDDGQRQRAELEQRAAAFREACPPDQESRYYVELALLSLAPDPASPSSADLDSARLHLGKAQDALIGRDDLAEAAKQVEHARQYLPSLTDSASEQSSQSLSAAFDCDRATRAIERSVSFERGGGELSHSHSTGHSRGRGRH
jgi:hypothetical protein